MEDGPGADRPLYELDDAALLHRVRSMFERRDPLPPWAVERARQSIRLLAMDVEASLVDAPDEPPGLEPDDSDQGVGDGYSASGTANSS